MYKFYSNLQEATTDASFICGVSVNIFTKAINDHYGLPVLSYTENDFIEFYNKKNEEVVHDIMSDKKMEVNNLENKNYDEEELSKLAHFLYYFPYLVST